MARTQKLKVYRTPIGFHDAYVAAPSQKAALAAWGADVDLFARGAAEIVDDAALSRAPLATPGKIVRVPRGTSAEHIAALPPDRPTRTAKAADKDDGEPSARRRDTAPPPEAAAPPEPKPRPKPRPSRARLDAAERAVESARKDHETAIAEIRKQEKQLQDRRRDLERRREAESARLDAALDKARVRYGAALEAWRA